MKNSFLFTILFASACSFANAQDLLEPCDDDLFPEYNAGVDNVIDRAVDEKPRLSITTYPSFSPEYGVRIVGNNVYLGRLKASFWYSSTVYDKKTRSGYKDFTKPKVKAKLSSAPLSPALIDRILSIYTAGITSSKKEKFPGFGFDGVTYRFTSPSAGCGEVRSPSEATRTYQLVDLAEHLGKHSKLSSSSSLAQSTKLIEQKVITLEIQ